jgi:hypothetical protein
MRRLLPAIALPLLVCALSPARAGEFPAFRAVAAAPGRVDLLHGSTTILRWRGLPGETGGARLAEVARRLNDLAWDGVSVEDVVVEKRAPLVAKRAAPPDAALVVQDVPLLRVDGAHAALAASQPMPLAGSWARNLRAAFAAPYVLARPGAVKVPVGETRRIPYGGRPGPQISGLAYAPAVATAEIDSAGRRLVVRGLSAGSATVVLQAGKTQAPVTLDVRPWAARVDDPVHVQVTGRPGAAEWLGNAARAAVWGQLVAQPAATVRLGQLQVGPGRGHVLLTASAPDCFSVKRPVAVTLDPLAMAPAEPERTVLSNEPERVASPLPLARAALRLGQPTRLLWHHVGEGPAPLDVVVSVANTGDAPARVHALGGDGGPSDDEVFAGHVAMQQFVSATRDWSGTLFSLPARTRAEVSRLSMPPGQIVSGLAQLQVLSGDGVEVLVEALAQGSPAAPLTVLTAPLPAVPGPVLELPGARRLTVTQTVGEGWQFVRVGKAAAGQQAMHPRLRGDYGVLYDTEVVFANPQRVDARLEIALSGGGGVVRGVVEVDDRLVETALLGVGVEELLYKVRSAEPEVRVRVRLTPQSGSNYPVTLTVRSFERQP